MELQEITSQERAEIATSILKKRGVKDLVLTENTIDKLNNEYYIMYFDEYIEYLENNGTESYETYEEFMRSEAVKNDELASLEFEDKVRQELEGKK